jgi:hypothetical protein
MIVTSFPIYHATRRLSSVFFINALQKVYCVRQIYQNTTVTTSNKTKKTSHSTSSQPNLNSPQFSFFAFCLSQKNSELFLFTCFFSSLVSRPKLPVDGYLRNDPNGPGFVVSSHCHFTIIHPQLVTHCSFCYLTW